MSPKPPSYRSGEIKKYKPAVRFITTRTRLRPQRNSARKPQDISLSRPLKSKQAVPKTQPVAKKSKLEATKL